MALSDNFCEAHIVHWEAQLAAGRLPYRAKWPSRLFHHAPIENAVEILRSMEIKSRLDLGGAHQVDAAAQEVIAAREDAHRFGRLYFRPRTPTQFHCEGIGKASELYQGAHSPVLIMLVLDAREVLTSDGVFFSDMNMQSPTAKYDESEEFFSAINFDLVYHDGSFDAGDRDAVIKARCAEVLVPSPFDISNALEFIYCRSSAERDYLLQMLGDEGTELQSIVRTSDDLRVFQKERAFVQYVKLQQNGVVFKLNARRDHADIDTQIRVRNSQGTTVLSFGPGLLKATSPSGGAWIVRRDLSPGFYEIEIYLEGRLAYQAAQIIDDMPF